MRSIGGIRTVSLPLAEATLLCRIAAALRTAPATLTSIAQLRGGGTATALAGLASAIGAAATIITYVVHQKLLCLVGWFDGHWLSDEFIVLGRAQPRLKEGAGFLEQTS